VSGDLVHLADRRPAPTAAQVTGQLVHGEFFVVVTVSGKDGNPVEARLPLAAARAHVDQVEAAIQVGEELGRRG
jgi:hypothetical protein